MTPLGGSSNDTAWRHRCTVERRRKKNVETLPATSHKPNLRRLMASISTMARRRKKNVETLPATSHKTSIGAAWRSIRMPPLQAATICRVQKQNTQPSSKPNPETP
ncbi:hypothetical protein HMPREF9080_01445 [Cardiobacterium valvarum F0432]|uniref:Uncharacterized protein n=1 Tax=Cardiobacterium valvarum F0432 TaxID=797473 RepID=G9ZFA0_9GAMM|nr:hypothetical protein HMPREF9080_01445 [Cardiobacterium valvarum F0432]